MIVAKIPGAHRLLQGLDHIGVIGVVFAAVDILEQAAPVKRLMDPLPGKSGAFFLILLEIGKAGPFDPADHAGETEVGHFAGEPHRLEQLRAAVGGDGRDAHLREDLQQALIDSFAIVADSLTETDLEHPFIDQLAEGFIDQIGIDRGRPHR
ncbi:MAG: hypothetical protein ACD_75C00096G0001, partial [uncultured bacterium]